MTRRLLGAALGVLLAVAVPVMAAAQLPEALAARVVRLDPAAEKFRELDPGLEGVRLIGVGESVHESEPFAGFRARLLKDLVRRHRVTALVLESGLAEVMEADDYVRGRTATIDFDRALPGGHGSLAEVRRTIEWLREWNHGPGRAHPVGVYGADLPGRAGSLVPALDRLREMIPDDSTTLRLVESIRPIAVQNASGWWKGAADKYAKLTAEQKASLATDVSLLADRVNHLGTGDPERLARARRLVNVIVRSEESLRLGMYALPIPRDQALAENTLWVLGRLRPGERAVYWAHNAHVQKVGVTGPSLPPGVFPASGMRFDVALGSAYFAVGTSYGGPARDDQSSVKPGSVDGALEALGQGSTLLVLRGAPPSAWLSEPRPMRFQAGYLTLPLGAAFDAVFYFERAEAAEKAAK
jgi:erythromycin esterase